MQGYLGPTDSWRRKNKNENIRNAISMSSHSDAREKLNASDAQLNLQLDENTMCTLYSVYNCTRCWLILRFRCRCPLLTEKAAKKKNWIDIRIGQWQLKMNALPVWTFHFICPAFLLFDFVGYCAHMWQYLCRQRIYPAGPKMSTTTIAQRIDFSTCYRWFILKNLCLIEKE